MHKFAYFLFPRFYSCQTKVNPSFFIQFRDDTYNTKYIFGLCKIPCKGKSILSYTACFSWRFRSSFFTVYESMFSEHATDGGSFSFKEVFWEEQCGHGRQIKHFFSCIIHMMIPFSITYFYHSENMFWFYSRMALEFAICLTSVLV